MLWHIVLFLGLFVGFLLIDKNNIIRDVKVIIDEDKSLKMSLKMLWNNHNHIVIIPTIFVVIIGISMYLTYGFWLNITIMSWMYIPLFIFLLLIWYGMSKDNKKRTSHNDSIFEEGRKLMSKDVKSIDESHKLEVIVGIGIFILLIVLMIGRPLFWYGSVKEEQDIAGNVELADDNMVTVEDDDGNEHEIAMPEEVKKDEIRMMPWEIASKHIKRSYGKHAPYLIGELDSNEGEEVIMDDTSPTVYDGHMYWNNIPRYEFMKWINRDGKGYVSLNASNYQDFEDNPADFEEENIKIHKSRIGWSKRMQRYARKTPNYGKYQIYQKRFTLDDKGNPKFIIYMSKPHRPKRFDTLERIVIVNATSGDVEYYDDFDNIPNWMDVVYPDYYVYDWLEWWAGNRKGMIHKWFDKSGIYEPSMSNTKFVMINGTSYWYTPMTQSQSNVLAGYVLTNTRTGESDFYERPSYVDYDTVLDQVDRDLRENIGEHGLDLYEAFLYRLPDTDEEVYVVPIYRARELSQVAIANPLHATDIVRGDSLDEAIKLYTGEKEKVDNKTENIEPKSIVFDNDTAKIYETEDTTYDVNKSNLEEGNISMEESWNNLILAREHLIQNTNISLKVVRYEGKIVDIYEPKIVG